MECFDQPPHEPQHFLLAVCKSEFSVLITATHSREIDFHSQILHLIPKQGKPLMYEGRSEWAAKVVVGNMKVELRTIIRQDLMTKLDTRQT
jgi:hypothetical protein